MLRRSRGQSMVEMALLLPVFFALIFGIIELGWYVYNYSALENAARRGSEQAAKEAPLPVNIAKATDGCVMSIRAETVRNLVLIPLANDKISVTYIDPNEGRKLGNPIEVRVQYTGEFLTPLFSFIGVSTFDLDFSSRRTIINTIITPEVVDVNGVAIGCP